MSQKNVELFIGKLVTDENFRQRFRDDQTEALGEMEVVGISLTGVEREAVQRLDLASCERFAGTLDPRILKLSFGPQGPSS